jgi:hypothetical protein
MSEVNIDDLSVAERKARTRGLDLYVFEEIRGARRCIEGHERGSDVPGQWPRYFRSWAT